MVEWKSEWVAFRDKQSIWPMCGFMLFVWSCRDKIKADMLFGVKENKDSALLLSPQVLPRHLFLSPLLIPLPCLLPLHILLSSFISSSCFDSSPCISPPFFWSSIHPTSSSLSVPYLTIQLLNLSLISPSLNFLLSFTHVSLYFSYFWSSLASHLFYFDFSHNFSSPLPLFLHIVSPPLLIYWLLSPFFTYLLIIWLLSSYLISPPFFCSSIHHISSSISVHCLYSSL